METAAPVAERDKIVAWLNLQQAYRVIEATLEDPLQVLLAQQFDLLVGQMAGRVHFLALTSAPGLISRRKSSS